jgi:hypothetical protein
VHAIDASEGVKRISTEESSNTPCPGLQLKFNEVDYGEVDVPSVPFRRCAWSSLGTRFEVSVRHTYTGGSAGLGNFHATGVAP